MLRDELYSKIGLVGSLELAILIPQKLGIKSFTKCRDRYRANLIVSSISYLIMSCLQDPFLLFKSFSQTAAIYSQYG